MFATQPLGSTPGGLRGCINRSFRNNAHVIVLYPPSRSGNTEIEMDADVRANRSIPASSRPDTNSAVPRPFERFHDGDLKQTPSARGTRIRHSHRMQPTSHRPSVKCGTSRTGWRVDFFPFGGSTERSGRSSYAHLPPSDPCQIGNIDLVVKVDPFIPVRQNVTSVPRPRTTGPRRQG
jgi:hypothetical protein